MTFKDIAAKVGMIKTTVYSICSTYLNNDCVINQNRKHGYPKGRRKLNILKSIILSEEKLREWANLSARKRALMITD